MTAPSPGIIAAAMQNAWYDSEDAYLAALGRALQVEYETIVGHGYLLQIDAPDLALERHITYTDRPLSAFLDFAHRVVATINAALVNIPRERVAHACVLGQLRGAARLRRLAARKSCRRSRKRGSAGSCCRSPIHATRMSIAAWPT